MGYVVNRQDRWYAVNYEGMDPLTAAIVAAGTPPWTRRQPARLPRPCLPHEHAAARCTE